MGGRRRRLPASLQRRARRGRSRQLPSRCDGLLMGGGGACEEPRTAVGCKVGYQNWFTVASCGPTTRPLLFQDAKSATHTLAVGCAPQAEVADSLAQARQLSAAIKQQAAIAAQRTVAVRAVDQPPGGWARPWPAVLRTCLLTARSASGPEPRARTLLVNHHESHPMPMLTRTGYC
jgi:hypothetical protein